MAILAKCANCERVGGFAEKPDDTLCLRCKKDSQSVKVKATKKEEEE